MTLCIASGELLIIKELENGMHNGFPFSNLRFTLSFLPAEWPIEKHFPILYAF